MNINITVFVQIINFFIAYAVLREILFLPLLQYMYTEQLEEKELIAAISKLSSFIEEHEKRRHVQLAALKKYFLATRPVLVTVSEKTTQQALDVIYPRETELEEFGKKLEILLRKKLLTNNMD